jgi:hypothetical protein
LRERSLVSSMSRPGNCHDNAVAESYFQLFKRERVRRQIYATRSDARADSSNYIEMFYNQAAHGTAGDASPVEFEPRHSQRLAGPGNFGAIHRLREQGVDIDHQVLINRINLGSFSFAFALQVLAAQRESNIARPHFRVS